MKIICYGELLLRLSSPRRELLLQSPLLRVCVGGAEANVATSLACFGHEVAMVSAVADHALGEACRGELRRRGVDVSRVRLAPGRMGLYFMAAGGGLRPSEVIYDRADSVFARLEADAFAWKEILDGADWLHLSGITPALGTVSTDSTRVALRAAREAGVSVSFDCNFRPKLWQTWDGDAAAILREMAGMTDLLFADERTLAMILPETGSNARAAGGFASLTNAAFAALPQPARIAMTTRREKDVDHHTFAGRLASRTGMETTEPRRISGVVDRIGSGDAFAAGLLHGLASGKADAAALEFAVAAACLKHSIPGDANLVGVEEVEALLAGHGFGVRR